MLLLDLDSIYCKILKTFYEKNYSMLQKIKFNHQTNLNSFKRMQMVQI